REREREGKPEGKEANYEFQTQYGLIGWYVGAACKMMKYSGYKFDFSAIVATDSGGVGIGPSIGDRDIRVVGLDLMADESMAERQPTKLILTLAQLTNVLSPAFSYFMYYCCANLYTLNKAASLSCELASWFEKVRLRREVPDARSILSALVICLGQLRVSNWIGLKEQTASDVEVVCLLAYFKLTSLTSNLQQIPGCRDCICYNDNANGCVGVENEGISTAKAAAASVLASNLGAESGMHWFVDESHFNQHDTGKSSDVEFMQSGGLRRRNPLEARSPGSIGVQNGGFPYAGSEGSEILMPGELAVDHQSRVAMSPQDAGWMARLAALLILLLKLIGVPEKFIIKIEFCSVTRS
ncbi:LOW QUALITY PROTEIN: hypothetical protein M8C21_024164, partial [Ambrosia artemisiifolia]